MDLAERQKKDLAERQKKDLPELSCAELSSCETCWYS